MVVLSHADVKFWRLSHHELCESQKNLGFQIVFFRSPKQLRNIPPATQATVAMKILLVEKPLSKADINILCNMSRIFYLLLTANFQEDTWAQATREDDQTSPLGSFRRRNPRWWHSEEGL